VHHQKHHQAYVAGANAILEKLDKAWKDNADLDMKATLKEFSFHIGGYCLHKLFFGNLGPAGVGGRREPKGELAKAIDAEFGKFERFKKEFTRLYIMQLEKHNVNVIPGYRVLMALDVWEHAYYLDYKNDRAKFIEAFWSLVNWDEVNTRYLTQIKK
jgi:Fe-Mn family superoxide dismutase